MTMKDRRMNYYVKKWILLRQWYETENKLLKYYGQTERKEEDRLQSVLH